MAEFMVAFDHLSDTILYKIYLLQNFLLMKFAVTCDVTGLLELHVYIIDFIHHKNLIALNWIKLYTS